MTIAVVWQEDGFQWCAADTRLVAGDDDRLATEIAAKIYAIPVVVSAMANGFPRQPHYWTQYGFVYAGAALPAAMICCNGLHASPEFDAARGSDEPTYIRTDCRICVQTRQTLHDGETSVWERRDFLSCVLWMVPSRSDI